MIALSICIVNWNTKDFLRNCLKSIFNNKGALNIEVWVVDNNSSDGSIGMIEEEFPEVNLIKNNENVGFGRANNQAIRKSSGKYILLLNPDTIILPNSLQAMISFLDRHFDIGAIGPKILDDKGAIDFSCARNFPTLMTELFEIIGLSQKFPKSKIFGKWYMGYWDHNDSREIPALSGSCMMIRKDIFDKIGYFDEKFFIYGEDIDLCFRIKKANWKIYYVSSSQIIHYGAESTKQILDKRMFYDLESKYIFFKKHYGLINATLYLFSALVAKIFICIGCIIFYPISSTRNKIKIKKIFLLYIKTFKQLLGKIWH